MESPSLLMPVTSLPSDVSTTDDLESEQPQACFKNDSLISMFSGSSGSNGEESSEEGDDEDDFSGLDSVIRSEKDKVTTINVRKKKHTWMKVFVYPIMKKFFKKKSKYANDLDSSDAENSEHDNSENDGKSKVNSELYSNIREIESEDSVQTLTAFSAFAQSLNCPLTPSYQTDNISNLSNNIKCPSMNKSSTCATSNPDSFQTAAPNILIDKHAFTDSLRKDLPKEATFLPTKFPISGLQKTEKSTSNVSISEYKYTPTTSQSIYSSAKKDDVPAERPIPRPRKKKKLKYSKSRRNSMTTPSPILDLHEKKDEDKAPDSDRAHYLVVEVVYHGRSLDPTEKSFIQSRVAKIVDDVLQNKVVAGSPVELEGEIKPGIDDDFDRSSQYLGKLGPQLLNNIFYPTVKTEEQRSESKNNHASSRPNTPKSPRTKGKDSMQMRYVNENKDCYEQEKDNRLQRNIRRDLDHDKPSAYANEIPRAFTPSLGYFKYSDQFSPSQSQSELTDNKSSQNNSSDFQENDLSQSNSKNNIENRNAVEEVSNSGTYTSLTGMMNYMEDNRTQGMHEKSTSPLLSPPPSGLQQQLLENVLNCREQWRSPAMLSLQDYAASVTTATPYGTPMNTRPHTPFVDPSSSSFYLTSETTEIDEEYHKKYIATKTPAVDMQQQLIRSTSVKPNRSQHSQNNVSSPALHSVRRENLSSSNNTTHWKWRHAEPLPDHGAWWMPREWARDRKIGAYGKEWKFEKDEELERQKALEVSRNPNVEKIRTGNFVRL